jgi:hypothetical protein
MTTRDFCFWLQGFFEINGEDKAMTDKQAKMVKEHLDSVFQHGVKSGDVAVGPPTNIPNAAPAIPPPNPGGRAPTYFWDNPSPYQVTC